MRILEKGRSYELNSMQGTNYQTIEFFERSALTNREFHNKRASGEAGEDIELPDYFFTQLDVNPDEHRYETERDGTTPEEVIKALKAHYESFQEKVPCEENDNIIVHLDNILQEQRKRVERRRAEGTFATLMK